MMESARGRWFLEEFARRNHGADTAKVLAAIERIESVIRGKDEAYRSFRGELLDMAEAIARTRAEVMTPVAETQDETPAPPPARPDVFAAAERIQDVAWTMREHGLDPRTCEQIEALAASILSASSLGDPNDHRAHKLGEVLQYLERRINVMLEGCAEIAQKPTEEQTETAGSPTVAALDLPDPGEAQPAIEQAMAGPAQSMPTQENTDSISDEERQPIEAPQSEPRSTVAAELAVTVSIPDPELPIDVAAPEVGSPQPEPTTSATGLTSMAEAARCAAPDAPAASIDTEPPREPAPSSLTGAIAAEPTDFLLAPLPPPIVSRSQPEPAEGPTASVAPFAETMAQTAPGPSAAPEESRDAAAPVAAPAPRAPARDPLAPLRAMSDAERIALFS